MVELTADILEEIIDSMIHAQDSDDFEKIIDKIFILGYDKGQEIDVDEIKELCEKIDSLRKENKKLEKRLAAKDVDRYIEGYKDGYEDGRQIAYDKWLEIIKLLRSKIDKKSHKTGSPLLEVRKYWIGYINALGEAITEIDDIFEEMAGNNKEEDK